MNAQIPVALRRRLDTFAAELGLPTAVIDELLDHHTVVTYPRNSTLFLRGAPADMIFWIVSGMVDVFSTKADNSRVMVRLAGPGEILGYVDFIDERGRRSQLFEAQARTKCEVALVTREHIFKLLQNLPPTQLLRVLEGVNTMWSATAHGWATFIGLDYRERLEAVLCDLAARFGAADSRGTILLTDLLHAKLAEMIGSSRPMITRLINQMVAEGVLERRGKQYILLHRVEPASAPAPVSHPAARLNTSLYPARIRGTEAPAHSTRLGGMRSNFQPASSARILESSSPAGRPPLKS